MARTLVNGILYFVEGCWVVGNAKHCLVIYQRTMAGVDYEVNF